MLRSDIRHTPSYICSASFRANIISLLRSKNITPSEARHIARGCAVKSKKPRKAVRRTVGKSCAKLTEDDVKQIIQRLLLGEKVTSIAKEFNVGHVTISDIKTHRNWTHLTDGIVFPNVRKSRKFNDQRN